MENAKIARFGSIFLLNLAVKEIIDILLTPFLIIEYGYITSLISTIIIYIIIGVLSVILYDRYKKDVLLIETLKKAMSLNEKVPDSNKLIHFVLRWMNKGKFVLGILSSFKNPGLLVLLYRDGYNLYNGFTGKNIWWSFLRNIFLIQIYYHIFLYTGFSLWEYLHKIL